MIGRQPGGLTLARHVDRERLVEHRRGERAAGDDPRSVRDERDLRGIGRAGRVGCVVAVALEARSAEAAAAGGLGEDPLGGPAVNCVVGVGNFRVL